MTITTEQAAAILSFISNKDSHDSLAEAIEAWNNSGFEQTGTIELVCKDNQILISVDENDIYEWFVITDGVVIREEIICL
jgi:hypothetical protein